MSTQPFNLLGIVIGVVAILAGCTTEKTSDPARMATEQLLLSTAADRAMESADLKVLAHRKVFLDAAYFDSYDSKYALGTIRDAISRAGAVLVDKAALSDIIVEARSGALSTDSSDSLFGLPSMTVPVPLTGALQTPEVAFYKSHKQNSTAKIALLAFASESRAHIYSSGPLDGKAYDRHSSFLFLSWIRTDLPEKQRRQSEKEKVQPWYPQTEWRNLPPTNVVRIHALTTNAPSGTMNSTNSSN